MEWLKKNFIQVLVLLAGMLLAWAALNARVMAIDEKVGQYPSQDWFELKFEQIDQSIKDNQEAILENQKSIKAHIIEEIKEL